MISKNMGEPKSWGFEPSPTLRHLYDKVERIPSHFEYADVVLGVVANLTGKYPIMDSIQSHEDIRFRVELIPDVIMVEPDLVTESISFRTYKTYEEWHSLWEKAPPHIISFEEYWSSPVWQWIPKEEGSK